MTAIDHDFTSLPPHLRQRALLDPRQAAEYLGISAQTLNNWRSVGRGPKYSRVGRLVRYRLEDLDAFTSSSK